MFGSTRTDKQCVRPRPRTLMATIKTPRHRLSPRKDSGDDAIIADDSRVVEALRVNHDIGAVGGAES